jgi:hypothetical protein
MAYTMISKDLLGCATARNKGTCTNRLNIRRDQLEPRILHALQHRLMDPALFKAFCEEFTREMNSLRVEGRATVEGWQSELGKVERQINSTVNAIADGMYHSSMKLKMDSLEDRKAKVD